MITKKLKYLFGKKVLFDSLSTEPISRSFGFDRGTPIDRYYISDFLTKSSSLIKGSVLEISENTYSKEFGKGVTSSEVLHYDDTNSQATIIGDLTKPETLPVNKVDCFICTQTLNFIFDVPNAILGAYHVLKPGGVFLTTVAGLCQISRYDMDRWGDYWRFTDLSVRRLFDPVFGPENVEVDVYGNVFSAISLLKGVAVEDIPDKSLLDVKDKDYQVVISVRATKK